jgi:hypothetical protein
VTLNADSMGLVASAFAQLGRRGAEFSPKGVIEMGDVTEAAGARDL